MIKIILWDFDNTLLDFSIAEKKAILATFDKMNLGKCTQKMINRYVRISDLYWYKIQCKEIDKDTALVKRYEDFFTEYGIDKKYAKEFNEKYSLALADTIVYNDHSMELLNKFKKDYKQYIVSNGVKSVQQSRLKASGFDKVVDGCFISDDIGYEKPSKEFFDYVFSHIEQVDKKDIMIVGDSLTSDIKGGKNVGIKTCWYNPKKEGCPGLYLPDMEVQNLNEISAIFDLINEAKL